MEGDLHADVMGGAEKPSSGLGRRALAFGHTVVLGSLFFPPFVLCCSLGRNMDVAYFVGRRALAPVLLLPFLVLVPITHLLLRPKRLNTFIVASLIGPMILFAAVGGFMREETDRAANALKTTDCISFEETDILFHAHKSATDLYDSCMIDPAYHGASVEYCQGYKKLDKEYGRALNYIKALESRFNCAGVCTAGERRLFENPGQHAPQCGAFVAEYLYGAGTQSMIIFWYSIFAFFASIPGYRRLFQPLVKAVENTT